MPIISGAIRFQFGEKRPDEEVLYELDDAHLPTFRAYVAEAIVLEELMLGLDNNGVRLTISARAGYGVAHTAQELTLIERAALLHRLRPFVLSDEPFSFFRTRNIVAQATRGDFIRAELKRIKDIYTGASLQNQLRVTSGSVLVNSEATLNLWLNAFEYHRDSDKAARVEATLAPLPEGISRPVFFMLLLQKADAVRYLGHIVQKLL